MNNLISSIGYGVFGFIVYAIIQDKTITISRFEMLSIILCSAMIGFLSSIFDFYKIPLIFEQIIHFVLTTIIIGFMVFCLNGNLNALKSTDYWIMYLFIYITIWITIELRLFLKVNKINEEVSKRNKKDI